MKIKKLISAALVLVLAFGFVVGAMPITAGAVYIPEGATLNMYDGEISNGRCVRLLDKQITRICVGKCKLD